MPYLPLDYDENDANRAALETWDLASEAGPPERDWDDTPSANPWLDKDEEENGNPEGGTP